MFVVFMRSLLVLLAASSGVIGFFPDVFGVADSQAQYARLVFLIDLWILLTDYRLAAIEERQRCICELLSSQFGIIATWIRRQCIFQQNREQEEEEDDADRM